MVLLKINISLFPNRVFGHVCKVETKTVTKGIDCMAELLCIHVFIVCHCEPVVCISLLALRIYINHIK